MNGHFTNLAGLTDLDERELLAVNGGAASIRGGLEKLDLAILAARPPRHPCPETFAVQPLDLMARGGSLR